MKKIKLLAIAIVIGTSSLFATEIVPDIPEKEIRTQISDLFSSPDFAIENNITVNVFYTINENGRINVLSVESYNQDILDYVRDNMHEKLVEITEISNKVYTWPLKFKKTSK